MPATQKSNGQTLNRGWVVLRLYHLFLVKWGCELLYPKIDTKHFLTVPQATLNQFYHVLPNVQMCTYRTDSKQEAGWQFIHASGH